MLANDANPTGNPMSAYLVNSASHGSVTLNTDGSFTYNVMGGYSGTDTFTYKVSAAGAVSNITPARKEITK